MKKAHVISIRLADDVLRPLDHLAQSNHTTRTKLIEQAISHFLSQRAIVQHQIIWLEKEPLDAC